MVRSNGIALALQECSVVHAYVGASPDKFTKVFSAHLAPVGGGDPKFFPIGVGGVAL